MSATGAVDEALLRVLLVTDGRGDAARLQAIVRAAVAGGLRVVQLREPGMNARQLEQLCARLSPVLEAVGGWLLVNDRVDVAAAGCAHGAHVGHRSLTPALARSVLGPTAPLGMSVHDAGQLAEAVAARCSYALLAPVWPTSCKSGVAALGPRRAGVLTAAVELPVLWLGGVTPQRARSIGELPPRLRPHGVAVRSAICEADDPRRAAAELVSSCAWAAAAGL